MSTFFLYVFLMFPGNYNADTGVYSGKALYNIHLVQTKSVGECNMNAMKYIYGLQQELKEQMGVEFRIAHKCVEQNDV